MKVNVTDSLRKGELFVPMHWNDQWARGARIGELVNPAVDPISGQPESKHTPCKVAPWHPTWSAVMLSRENLALPDCEYAAKVRGETFYRYELAGTGSLEQLNELAQKLAQRDTKPSMHYQDNKLHNIRCAWLGEQGLATCIYMGAGGSDMIANADRNWLASLFEKQELQAVERKALLSGKSPAGVEDCGRTICACYGVGEKTILKAIRQHHLKDAAAVGKLLKAGTNCGSCVSEIKNLLQAE